MTGLLSLPSELLFEIIETVSNLHLSQLAILMNGIHQCPQSERCRLRATCKVLNEHAEPIVFRRLCLYSLQTDLVRITADQIIAIATRSFKACEFTRNLDSMDYRRIVFERVWNHRLTLGFTTI
jgi:hypothetical protein